ncbi:MAG: HAD-IIB family hydrolase [Eggerthellales bacterium]|nr:HAD-IIB family hydrolase [Eggerthellales bacterium]
MNRKYFFFDYDGTLAVPHTYTIPESTRACLKALEDQGHFVALATGRLQCNALDYVKSANIRNIVADGGYSVTYEGELVWMQPLPLAPVQKCLRRLDAAGVPWAVTTENELKRYTNNPRFDEISGDYYVPTTYDPTLTIDDLTQVHKIYIPAKQGQEADYERAGLLEGVPWVRYTSDTVFVEPMEKSVGVKKMMDILGAPYEDVVVFGDGLNDVSMFLPEWTSIAMGNAKAPLKELADYITDDCDKDGILKACQHFGWVPQTL